MAPVATSTRPTAATRPAWRRLHVRIVGWFLGLLLLVQAVSLVALRQSIEERADREITGDLRTGEVLIRRQLTQNAQRLSESAQLIVSDAAFRAAVTTADKAPLQDALQRHRKRLGATLAIVTDRERKLVAGSEPDTRNFLNVARTSLNLRSDGPDAQWGIFEGRPQQLISAPVRAPELIGHLVLAFPLTATQLQAEVGLTAVKLRLLTRLRGQTRWDLLEDPVANGSDASPTGPAQDRTDGLIPAADLGTTGPVKVGREEHQALLVPMMMDEQTEMAAWLLRSAEEVIGPYRQLQRVLLQITFWGIVVMAAGSLLMARRVTVPLQQLTRSADRLGAGDFSTPVAASGADEVGDLALSFERMRQAMQAREAQILQLAYWDPLTDLPNRAQFRQKADELVERSIARQEPCTILMLDLDRFKLINDVMGHAFGDRVLKKMAQRLTEGVLRQDDLLARLSGDEFAMCLPGLSEAQAVEVGHRVLTTLERPLQLDDQTIDVTGSIGVAVSPAHGHDANLLLSHAEVAMYAAKASRLGVRVFDESLDSSSASSLSLLTELRTAVDTNQLQVYLQPKVRLRDGEVVGAEALVRWEHPERGLVQPMHFVPFAEQSGFVRALTAWMIEHTARYAGSIAHVLPEMKFGVNLSARDLLDQDFADKVRDLVGRSGMNFSRLTLEITESSIMEDPERSLQTLLKLRALGLRLSIDDFGTGYSSLAYLKRLPLDELKIDRSFVMSMQTDPADAKIVRSTIDLAHNLGLSVVAEGIDSPEAFALLRDLGCDEGQGYRLARPMPAAYFAEWARRWQNPALESSPGELSGS